MSEAKDFSDEQQEKPTPGLKTSEGFLSFADQPITSANEDILGWREYANDLSNWIEVNAESGDWVVGVQGPWGSGKSSFIRLFEQRYLEYTRAPMIFRFQPWLFSGSTELATSFCREFSAFLYKQSRVSNAVKTAAALVSKYGDALVKVAHGGAFAFGPLAIPGAAIVSGGVGYVKSWDSKHGNGASIQDLKSQIVEELNRLSGKIVIIIDDVDRLQHSEILQLFQVIRAIANFPNVVYVLGYDHSVIVKSLEQAQKGNPEEYLEKIVNYAIRIPVVAQHARRGILKDVVDDAFGGSLDPTEQARLWSLVESLGVRVCKSLRSIKRFRNTLRWWIRSLGSQEIDPGDLFIIAMIQAREPSLWEIFPRLLDAKIHEQFGAGGPGSALQKVLDEIKEAHESWYSFVASEEYLGLKGQGKQAQSPKRVREIGNLQKVLELVDRPGELSNFEIERSLHSCTSMENARMTLFRFAASRMLPSFCSAAIAFLYAVSDDLKLNMLAAIFSLTEKDVLELGPRNENLARLCEFVAHLSGGLFSDESHRDKICAMIENSPESALVLIAKFLDQGFLDLPGYSPALPELPSLKEREEKLKEFLCDRIRKNATGLRFAEIPWAAFLISAIKRWGYAEKAAECWVRLFGNDHPGLIEAMRCLFPDEDVDYRLKTQLGIIDGHPNPRELRDRAASALEFAIDKSKEDRVRLQQLVEYLNSRIGK
jgi:hypothetical protein